MTKDRLLAIGLVALVGALASGLAAQDFPTPYDPLVTITVSEDRPYTRAHTIEIVAADPVHARTQAQLEGRLWRARRVSERGIEHIDSRQCPALRSLALSFADLPPLFTNPRPSLAHGGLPGSALPIPPSRKDGFSTRLTFNSVTADGSEARVETQGGNAFARWGHEAVVALLPCWGPLTPPSTP